MATSHIRQIDTDLKQAFTQTPFLDHCCAPLLPFSQTARAADGLEPGLGRAEKREHSPSREHRENVSYRLGKWEYDHGLGLGFRFPVSLPHTFYMRNGFVSEIRAPQKVIMRNTLDMFSEARVSQKRSRFACKMYGGARDGESKP